MNKNEQDLIQELAEKTENIQIPEQLEPENISEMLEKKGKKRRLSPYKAGALIAACIVLVAGAAVYENTHFSRDLTSDRTQESEEEISTEKTVALADDYEEVYSYIERYKEEMERQMSAYDMNAEDGGVIVEDRVEMMAESSDADMGAAQEAKTSESSALNAAGGTAGSNDYSETNVRQEGVDEGDVVKTDGTYLYVLKDSRQEISIVDTRNNEMKEVSVVSLEDTQWIEEIYLQAGRLVLICTNNDDEDGLLYARSSYWYGNTEAVTYDITDPENPKEVGKIAQNGTYQSSRVADGYLYLFSNYGVAWDYMEKDKPETYVPIVNGAVIDQSDICLPPSSKAYSYTVVTAVELKEPSKVSSSKAILSEGGSLYVSNENIYYYETIWNSSKERTTLRRIAYKDGKLQAGAQGTIDGYINDSFSIDEYDNYLRVVTTEKDTNSVYVLDMDLEVTGSIEGLAEDERIYSARLMGDTGYFVTFKETDPLFSVDFSNPKKPKIIGELKIPGFSDYLHPYGEGKLLGIGMNVDEETMITDGVKLTMFDISNPADVKEEDTYILENVYGTEVSYDYKAALVDVEKNIIGFTGNTEGGQKYYIFEYDKNNGFICKMEEEINGRASLSTRGLYISDTLYVVQGNIIEAYSLKEYSKVDDIIL